MLLSAAPECAFADGLPGFKKDMRPVRSRNKVDADLYEDGPDGLKCAYTSASVHSKDRSTLHQTSHFKFALEGSIMTAMKLSGDHEHCIVSQSKCCVASRHGMVSQSKCCVELRSTALRCVAQEQV
jgi:hypothetical protein